MGIRVSPVDGGPKWALSSTYFSPKLVAAAKAVPGMFFDRASMSWHGSSDAVVAVAARLRHDDITVSGVLPTADSWKTSRTAFLYATKGLREYQIEGVKFLLARASEGALLADGMRLGKSAESLAAARAWRQKTLVVCQPHAVGVWARGPKAAEGPGEVAKWWPDAWKAPHEVVCLETVAPAKAKGNDIAKYVERIAHAMVVVCHYEILYAWEKVLLAWGVETFIIDECFPAGTVVETSEGPRRIEDFHPGDTVSHALGRGCVKTVSTRAARADECILVRTEGGREFIVTRRHPILTRIGWFSAEALCPGLELVDVSYTHMLASYHEENSYSTAAGTSTMPAMQKDEDDLDQEERLLLAILRNEAELEEKEVSKATARISNVVSLSRENATAHHEHAQGSPRVCQSVQRTDAQVQSGTNARGEGAHDRKQEGTRYSERATGGPRGKRLSANESRTDVEQNTQEAVGATVDNSTRRRAAPVQVCSGYRTSKEEDRGGSRRGESFSARSSSSGSTSRCPSGVNRVAGVTVPQRADFERLGLRAPDNQGSVQVYNLQVAGHPSYAVAGGLVVHNCHILAGYQSRRLASIVSIGAQSKRRILLSGTPVVGEPRKLHNLLNVLSPNRMGFFFLHDKKMPDGTLVERASYSKVFCAAHQETVGKGEAAKTVWKFDGRSNLDTPDGKWCLTEEETLAARLKFCMLRRLKKDVDPQLPEKQRQIIDVSIPARQVITPSRGMLGPGGGELRRVLDLAADGKLKHGVELLLTHLAEGEKEIGFCYRRLFAERVASDVAKKAPPGALVEFVHGGMSRKERDEKIHRVRKHVGPALLACTIDTTSTAIDLSFAGVSVFLELVWEPHDLAQCEERTYRFGDNRGALIQYIIARGTGDELILRAVINKLDTFEKLIGSTGDRMKEDLGRQRGDALKRLSEALAQMQKAKGGK